jgi:hypothetical protein
VFVRGQHPNGAFPTGFSLKTFHLLVQQVWPMKTDKNFVVVFINKKTKEKIKE